MACIVTIGPLRWRPPPASHGGRGIQSVANTARVVCLFVQIHYSDLVHPAACQIKLLIGSCNHIADYTAAGWDRLRAGALRLGIEPYQSIGPDARFAVPDLAILRDRDSIRF